VRAVGPSRGEGKAVTIDSSMVADVRPVEAPERRAAARRTHPAVWCFRALIAFPFVVMTPEIVAAAQGRAGAAGNISTSVADVLGNAAFILFILMLAVTPVQTITGWKWHVVLRRDLGMGMFAVAAFDLVLAALFTGDTFHGGFFDRIGGHTFLAAGTLAVLLLVPLALTSTQRAKRWLGRNWKWLHRLTYVVWAIILFHLALLFSLTSFFLDAVLVSVPLFVLRLPPVARWWSSSRRTGRHKVLRGVLTVALVVVFVVGFVPFVHQFVTVSKGAISNHPVDD